MNILKNTDKHTCNSGKTIYRSRIDWWVWLCVAISLGAVWLASTDMLWFSVILGSGLTALYLVMLLGCWYEIDGTDLIVYQFFRPTRLPIAKIKDIRKTTGYLATAGMSRHRVSIRFTDRSVLKSFAPMEISPANREAFIAHIIRLNPDVDELKN